MPPLRDQHRYRQALPVAPVIEGGESIAAGVGGRERERGACTPPDSNRRNPIVAPDSQRSWGELDVERRGRVDVAVGFSSEPQSGQRGVELCLPNVPLDDEVHVLGNAAAARVQTRTGATGQNRPHSSAGQRDADGERYVAQCRATRQFHNGFPERRGRRRSVSARRLSSPAASASRARYWRSSAFAK